MPYTLPELNTRGPDLIGAFTLAEQIKGRRENQRLADVSSRREGERLGMEKERLQMTREQSAIGTLASALTAASHMKSPEAAKQVLEQFAPMMKKINPDTDISKIDVSMVGEDIEFGMSDGTKIKGPRPYVAAFSSMIAENPALMTDEQGKQKMYALMASKGVSVTQPSGEYKPKTKEEKLDFEREQEAIKTKSAKELEDYKAGLQASKEGKDKSFEQGTKMRGEFIQQSKTFVEVRDAQNRIKASAKDPSAAGDLALIFNYMKILDPGSTVREGEFANAANSAGIPDRIRAQYNKVINGERLADDQRADFVKRADMLYKEQERTHKELRSEYGRIAKKRSISEDEVIVDYLGGAVSDEQGNVLPPEAVSQLKEGKVSTFGNGQVWTLKNGKPVKVK